MKKPMKIDLKRLKKLSELTKLEAAPPSALAVAGDNPTVSAIIQVTEPNYVPPAVRVRARIDPRLFTADFRRAVLTELEADPKVLSVALSRPQQLID